MNGIRLAVRWRDLDPLGHVNAGVFLTYLEEGRSVWLQRALGDYFGPDDWVIARIEVDYRAEIPQGTDHVLSTHALESIGRSSITLTERLIDPEGATVADARVVIVVWDPRLRRSRPVSDGEREALAATAVDG